MHSGALNIGRKSIHPSFWHSVLKTVNNLGLLQRDQYRAKMGPQHEIRNNHCLILSMRSVLKREEGDEREGERKTQWERSPGVQRCSLWTKELPALFCTRLICKMGKGTSHPGLLWVWNELMDVKYLQQGQAQGRLLIKAHGFSSLQALLSPPSLHSKNFSNLPLQIPPLLW